MPESVKPESEITNPGPRAERQADETTCWRWSTRDCWGLTRFRTPDPYLYFNATEALGVRTWDLFDHVIGAYGGRIEQLFAIGGDAEQPNTGALRAQRFKPVVRFLGAEKLGAGKTNTHKIALPPYFGSVRVMVVAYQRPRLRLRGEGGRREKTAPGAGDPAPRGLHGGGDRTSGHGLRPRKRGR